MPKSRRWSSSVARRDSSERSSNPLLHHMVRDFRTQIDVFEKLCVATTELSDPVTAFREIDRVLDACMRFKRPVYIEIPRDMVDVVPQIGHTFQEPDFPSDRGALSEAVAETRLLLESCAKPLILAGVEIHRFGLQDQLLALAEATQIPIAATLLGKSVIRETHPLYVGLYEGAVGRQRVTDFVEDSDCLLLLGTFMTDINLGIFTANLDPSKCIYATSEQLRIRHHHYHDVQLEDFVQELTDTPPRAVIAEMSRRNCIRSWQPFRPGAGGPDHRSVALFARLNEQLDEETIVIADIGDSLFGATELVIRGRTEFVSPAYYTSMGFSVPAALGAQVARPESRVVVICGDGAFQMTGQELSTLVRHGFDPVIIVLDNRGYGTERKLHAGTWKFNAIQPWNYSRLTEVYGGGHGYTVRTEADFDTALQAAWDDRSGRQPVACPSGPDDCSRALQRLAERLGRPRLGSGRAVSPRVQLLKHARLSQLYGRRGFAFNEGSCPIRTTLPRRSCCRCLPTSDPLGLVPPGGLDCCPAVAVVSGRQRGWRNRPPPSRRRRSGPARGGRRRRRTGVAQVRLS